MEFEKLISERYSVRKFKSEKLKKEDIDKILEAGNIAPTGCNNQPQRILVLSSDEAIEKLKACTRCHFNAPNAMLICHNVNESWKRPYDHSLASPVDASIVATHMMLEAYNIGIGSCWVMHFNPFEIKKAFNIPHNIEPLALLVLGYPAKDSKPFDLHYKKKNIEETVIYESF